MGEKQPEAGIPRRQLRMLKTIPSAQLSRWQLDATVADLLPQAVPGLDATVFSAEPMTDKKINQKAPILVSWIALKNDPYDQDAKGGKGPDGEKVREPGPTLTLLFDDDSPYHGAVHEMLLLHREGDEDADEAQAVRDTVAEIEARQPGMRIHHLAWKADDPTDHRGIFTFLRDELVPWRRRHADRPLLIHISTGTPSMQTLWVLMAETGLIPPPVTLVKSYRRRERKGRPAVVPVEVGIETFYKAYLLSRPRQSPSVDQAVVWDPGRFRSPQLLRLYAEARRFAQLNVPVLILGERGTGKTTLAAWLRQSSPFRRPAIDASWPVVACGQYSPETMRAELCGYVAGAFTDAKKAHEGLLALADGDSLFLDEIGDISYDVQRLLIKAVEEKQYQRLGDLIYRKSDFRLLCATNLPPAQLRKRLSADFWDRVSMFQLHLPPLREIPDDLGWLWEQVYEQAARRAGVSPRQTVLGQSHHERIVRALRGHPLPRNLRDLLRIAYHVLAARTDAIEPLSPAEAVEYALRCLEAAGDTSDEGGNQARALARRFANNEPLDEVLATGALNTDEVLAEIKKYTGSELRRIAHSRRVAVTSLCDKTERSLFAWEKASRSKSSD